MPLLSTLIDNFNDNEIGPEWGDSYGGVSEVGGQARVPLLAGTYAGYQTGRAWTFAGASVYLKLVTRPAASTGTDVSCSFLVTSATPGTSLGFKYNAVTNVLRMHSMVDYYDPTGIEIPFDAVNHLWLRLREDGTNVYWDTSPDGTVWTNRRTLATPAWVPASVDTCALDLFAYRDAGATDYAAYDNINTLNDGAVWNGTAALTGETSLTSTVLLSARTGADLTADTTLSAGLVLSAHAGADLTGEAVLEADAASTEIPEVAGLSAGDWDLYIEQGATFVQRFSVDDDPDFTWAGWTARAQIRSEASEKGELLLNLTPYLTIIGGSIQLAIPAPVTETLTRNGRWDLEVVQGATVVRLLNGKVTISPEVTR